MRQVKWVTLVVVLITVPQPAPAQKPGRTERRIGRLMGELRDEMWAYRRELEFFRRAPEYGQLVELRYRLRAQAIRVAELEAGGRRTQREQLALARQMEATASNLKRLTGRLENRTDVAAPAEARRRADRLKARADRIRNQIDRLHELVR
jgi:hypothetical protein